MVPFGLSLDVPPVIAWWNPLWFIGSIPYVINIEMDSAHCSCTRLIKHFFHPLISFLTFLDTNARGPCFLSPYILMYAFHLSRLLDISIKYFALVEKSKLSFLIKHRTLLMKSKALRQFVVRISYQNLDIRVNIQHFFTRSISLKII